MESTIADAKQWVLKGKLQVPSASVALVGLALFCIGCDRAEEATATLEETLREQASTEPKTGVLRALQVRSRAAEVARLMAAPSDRACALELPNAAPFRYRWALELTRRSAVGVEARWRETRVLRRDADGDLALEMQADFRTELGLEGRRNPQRRVVGGQSYVSDDGRAFYRRSLQTGERHEIIEAAGATMQTLLDAVPNGWSLQESMPEQTEGDSGAAAYRIGGERLVCGPSAEAEAGWLRRFETKATPLSGELQVGELQVDPEGSRSVEIRWQLEDGSTLEASFVDGLAMGAAPVEAPDDADIVSVERDRSLHQVEQMLSQMAEAGLVEQTPSPSTGATEPNDATETSKKKP